MFGKLNLLTMWYFPSASHCLKFRIQLSAAIFSYIPVSYKDIMRQFLRLRKCYVCVHLCTHGQCVHTDRYTGRIIVMHYIYIYIYITIMFALPSGLVKLFEYLFVECLCPFSYCLLLLSSFNFWLDGLYKKCIYDNVWLSLTHEYITVIRDAFLCTKILNWRPQILTVPVLPGIFH